MHRVPPVDTLFDAFGEVVVVDRPHLVEECLHPSERTAVGGITETGGALGEHLAERRVGKRDCACNKQGPYERAVKALRSGRDVVHSLAECADKVGVDGLSAVEIWDQAAEVDASRQAVDCSHVPAELPGKNLASRRKRAVVRANWWFRQADLLAEKLNVLAKLDIVHTLLLEGVEASNFRDQVHDSVFTAHKLSKTRRSIGNELLAVGVGKGWCPALHGCAKDVNPRSEGHVEGRLGLLLAVHSDKLGREL